MLGEGAALHQLDIFTFTLLHLYLIAALSSDSLVLGRGESRAVGIFPSLRSLLLLHLPPQQIFNSHSLKAWRPLN